MVLRDDVPRRPYVNEQQIYRRRRITGIKIPLTVRARAHAPARRSPPLPRSFLSSFIFLGLWHLKIGGNTGTQSAKWHLRDVVVVVVSCRCANGWTKRLIFIAPRRSGTKGGRGRGRDCSIYFYLLFLLSPPLIRVNVANNYGPIACISLAAWERCGIILSCG